jgi:hypothetical protein
MEPDDGDYEHEYDPDEMNEAHMPERTQYDYER